MKYVIIIPDGCADEPQGSLGGRTPLQAAETPAMDAIARRGLVGAAAHVPPHLPPGSDVATLSLLGYDPLEYFTGRAPLEAAAQGIELGPKDWAIRCNLVTIEDQVMRDFTAGHVSSDEARGLLEALRQQSGRDYLEFWPGVSYRNLLVFRGDSHPPPFSSDTRCTPPHDLTDKSVADDYPRGPGCQLLCDLMNQSVSVFRDHPVNRARRESQKMPATNIWLWGCGQAPRLTPFLQKYGQAGAMITAVDLLRGLAKLVGWHTIEVPGATGYTDTDYGAKGRYAINHLDTCDILCVHVEATDEASHEGDVAGKIAALEAIDEHIVRPLAEVLESRGAHRILISPDHPTPVRTKTHSHGSVPFTMAGDGIAADASTTYDEVAAESSAHQFPRGFELMAFFLDRS